MRLVYLTLRLGLTLTPNRSLLGDGCGGQGGCHLSSNQVLDPLVLAAGIQQTTSHTQ